MCRLSLTLLALYFLRYCHVFVLVVFHGSSLGDAILQNEVIKNRTTVTEITRVVNITFLDESNIFEGVYWCFAKFTRHEALFGFNDLRLFGFNHPTKFR